MDGQCNIKEKQQKYLYLYPPDIQKCKKHRMAMRIFKGLDKNPVSQVCECCDRKLGVEETNIGCCYDKKDLAFLGPGVPLLFNYIRNSIIMLLAMVAIFVIFSIYSNLTSGNCKQGSVTCDSNIFNLMSFPNKLNDPQFLAQQNYVLLGFVVVNVILFQWFRFNFRKLAQRCDQIINSPSDYAMILRRLPPSTQKTDIEKMIEQKRETLSPEEAEITQNLKVDHIVMSFSLSEYTRIKNENLSKFKQLIKQGQKKWQEFKPEPLPALNETASIAIVIFTHSKSKDLFMYKPSIIQKLLQCLCTPCTPLSDFKVKNSKISVERAPEPDDIVWQNCNISMGGAVLRKTIFNILGIALLLGGGAIQYGFALFKNEITDPTLKMIMTLVIAIIIAFINLIILQFLVLTSRKERNETLTEFKTVLTVKISFFQFLNTGFFVVAANFLADIDDFNITQNIAQDAFFVMIINAFSYNIVTWALKYFQIVELFFRMLNKFGFCFYTQIQANQSQQGPPNDIPYEYGFVLKTIWLTAFYAPLVPITVPISIIGLVMNYFLEKYLYRSVYSAPNMLSSMINDSAIELMEYFPLILSFGQFFLYFNISGYNFLDLTVEWSILLYASLALSLLNLLLPMDEFNTKCFKLQSDSAVSPPYHQVETKFEVTYEMTNPGYVCHRKRSRDKLVFNHIFQGQGQDAAIEMINFGAPTDRSQSKDPLLGKKQHARADQNNVVNNNGIKPSEAIFPNIAKGLSSTKNVKNLPNLDLQGETQSPALAQNQSCNPLTKIKKKKKKKKKKKSQKQKQKQIDTDKVSEHDIQLKTTEGNEAEIDEQSSIKGSKAQYRSLTKDIKKKRQIKFQVSKRVEAEQQESEQQPKEVHIQSSTKDIEYEKKTDKGTILYQPAVINSVDLSKGNNLQPRYFPHVEIHIPFDKKLLDSAAEKDYQTQKEDQQQEQQQQVPDSFQQQM